MASNEKPTQLVRHLVKATANSRLHWTAIEDDGYMTVIDRTRVALGWASAFNSEDGVSIDRQALCMTVGPHRLFFVWGTQAAEAAVELLKLLEQKWAEHFDYVVRWARQFARGATNVESTVKVRYPMKVEHERLLLKLLNQTKSGLLKWSRCGRSNEGFQCITKDGREVCVEMISALGVSKGNSIPFSRLSVPCGIFPSASGTLGMYLTEQILALISRKWAVELKRRDEALKRTIASLEAQAPKRKSTLRQPLRSSRKVNRR